MRRLLRHCAVPLALAAALALAIPATGAGAAPWSWPKPQPLSCSAPVIHKANGQPWTCTFDDEFNASVLDNKKWIPVTTADNGVTAGTGGCFVDSPRVISVGGGQLRLTARKEYAPFTCNSPLGRFTTQYAAGQVATSGKFAQTHGRFAVRAAFPAPVRAGLQSALWLWPQDFATPLAGEIDLAEQYSQYPDRVIPYLHYAYDPATTDTASHSNVVTNNYCMVADVSGFHEYVLEWTSTTMTIRYDGRTCLIDNYRALGGSPFDQPFFVALSQAFGIGSNAVSAVTPTPATTRVDWVRVWT